MKRILSIFLAIIAVFSLVACKPEEDKPAARTYVADGKYTAFSNGSVVNNNYEIYKFGNCLVF